MQLTCPLEDSVAPAYLDEPFEKRASLEEVQMRIKVIIRFLGLDTTSHYSLTMGAAH